MKRASNWLCVACLALGLLGCKPQSQPRNWPITPLKAVEPLRLVVFYTTWCGSCRQAEPFEAQIEAAGFRVDRHDIDREPQLATKYQIRIVPTFLIVKGDKVVQRTNDIQEVLRIFERGRS